ncbi:MAG TPA: hypothetical protein DDY71_01495 [Spirochaetia bacterium]|nr:hypothetical protein [Spirochaetia bacterium]
MQKFEKKEYFCMKLYKKIFITRRSDMLYNVFDDIYRLNREIDRVLKSGDVGQYRDFPAVNVYENKDEYALIVRIPGVEKDKIKLTTKENALKISAERTKDDEGKTYYLNERVFGQFERSFMFDEKINPDKITADLKDGILLIKLPKVEEAKPKAITIN